MSIREIYTIKDNAVNAYMQPLFVRSRGEAVRMFRDEVENKQSMINKHPADYDLYYIGIYDEETGHIEKEGPERVARAIDFVIQTPPQQ